MKIAFIDYVLDPARPGTSGLSDVVWNMARELAKLGDDVHIIGPYSVAPPPVTGITVHRFQLPPIGYRNIAGHILIVLAAWRIARRIPDLDVIHAPEYLTTGILAPFSRVPIVLTTPGNIYERIAHGNPFDPLTTQVLKVAARSSARWCMLINAISNDMAIWWEKTGAAADRVVVIPHGINLSLFRSQRSRPLRRDDDPLRLLYVGRFSAEKNVSLLPTLMSELGRRGMDAHLDIVGKGPLETRLRAQVIDLDIERLVSFHQWMNPNELVRMYSDADLLLVPSKSEPLGRVIMEAMACGTPVVGARAGGIPDLITDGTDGFLFDPDDLNGLMDLIQHAIDCPATLKRLSANALKTAHEKWDWSTVMRSFREAVAARLPNTAAMTGALVEEGT